MGLLGTDAEAELARRKLEERCIDMSFIQTKNGRTGSTKIELDENGERTITRNSENSVTILLPEYISLNLRSNAGFHIDPNHTDIHLKSGLDALRATLENGFNVFSMDISTIAAVDNSEYLVNILKKHSDFRVRYLFGNMKEFRGLAQAFGYSDIRPFHEVSLKSGLPAELIEDIFRISEKMRSDGIFLKMGSNGAAYIGASNHYCPAPSVDVRDTTGAGDAFNAGALFGLWSGLGSRIALTMGVTLGSQKCEYFGAQPTALKLDSVIDNL